MSNFFYSAATTQFDRSVVRIKHDLGGFQIVSWHDTYEEAVAEAARLNAQHKGSVMSTWDHRFIELARHVSQWSKDPRTKVGAVLVGTDKRQVALGFNGFPPGIEDTPTRLNDRSTKHALIQHAERNVLDNAHFDVRGGTIYLTMFPCSECAKSIISRGIQRVVSPAPSHEEPWRQDADHTIDMLREASVTYDLAETPA